MTSLQTTIINSCIDNFKLLKHINEYEQYKDLLPLANNNNNQLCKHNQRAFGRELTNIQPYQTQFQTKFMPTRPSHRNLTMCMVKPVILHESTMHTLEEQMSIEIQKKECHDYMDSLNKDDNNNIDNNAKNSIVNVIENRHDMDLEELDKWDREDLSNPQIPALYNKEIFDHLRSVEDKYTIRPGYMARIQTDINEKMRAILIDWLVDVHVKFRLLPETLYLTVNIIDRFLERVQIIRQRLQLVGVSALLIACKYEEIYAPEVKDLVIVTDQAYKKEEILEMEGKILSALMFNITVPSSLRFLQRYSRIANISPKAYMLCCYVTELSLIEYKMISYMPSMIASACIWLVNRLYKGEGWSDDLKTTTKYEEDIVKCCVKDILIMLQNVEKSQLIAIKRKYSTSKMMEVSKIKIVV